MAKYHLTKKAVEDIDSIWEYTYQSWSERQADEYYESLVQTFNNIAEKPYHNDKEYIDIHPGIYGR